MSDCSSEEVMNMIGENLSQKETKVCLGILLDMTFSYWISLYTLFHSEELLLKCRNYWNYLRILQELETEKHHENIISTLFQQKYCSNSI